MAGVGRAGCVDRLLHEQASPLVGALQRVFSGAVDLGTTSPTTYTGVASFFVAGAVTAANGSVLCVHVLGSTCDFANATNTSSSDYWDATQSVLITQSQGALTATNLAFQGGLYSSTSTNLGGGQSLDAGTARFAPAPDRRRRVVSSRRTY